MHSKGRIVLHDRNGRPCRILEQARIFDGTVGVNHPRRNSVLFEQSLDDLAFVLVDPGEGARCHQQLHLPLVPEPRGARMQPHTRRKL